MTLTHTRVRRYRSRRRGFAALTAIALIALVGFGLAAMAALFAAETRRTGRVREDAQLRQLLLAGEVAAREALSRGERRGAVALPVELTTEGVRLTFAPAGEPGERETRCRVTARTGDGRVMSQRLTYEMTGASWTLRAAELE
jgi:Zn-dependent alcohol dehydrogenase